jgi:hypothetical protein
MPWLWIYRDYKTKSYKFKGNSNGEDEVVLKGNPFPDTVIMHYLEYHQ